MTAARGSKTIEKQIVIGAIALGVLGVIAVVVMVGVNKTSDAPCGAGFTRLGARCCPTPEPGTTKGTCGTSRPTTCPAPLLVTARGCDAPTDPLTSVVRVPKMTLTIGPSDWEAEGRVAPRTIEVEPFAIDRFEVTVGRFCAGVTGLETERSEKKFDRSPLCENNDPGRAAFGVPFQVAREYCARAGSGSEPARTNENGARSSGGRLPTEDEWLAVAAGSTTTTPKGEEGGAANRPRRYPWGDTGAVCRRAAFGLALGPCAEGGDGPDTVGAHPDGATPVLFVHDLAGNVAEWVETGACGDHANTCMAVVRGGSWKTNLATELRTWARREVSSEERDPTIGFRCAYRLMQTEKP